MNRSHGNNLMCRYGISPEQYAERLARQDGVCAICREECVTGQRLSVDHDHATERVRGLLCRKCNSRLGWYEGNSNRVRAYLRG